MCYFIYARKSSESEDRQVQSIDDQLNRLKELAKTQKLDVVGIFTESQSAKNPSNRPEFAKMLEAIKAGKAEGILCWEINRLSRNPVDSGHIQWLLQEGTIKQIKTISREYKPDDNAIIFAVDSGQANQFIRDLRKDTIRGMKSKLEKGWMPNVAPIGYLNDKEEKIIVKDPERFDFIRKMWDMMLSGNYTPPGILDIANSEWGLRTRKAKHAGGTELSRSGLYNVFTNLFYAGIIVYNGIEHQGKHEAMITLSEYDRVQMLLGRQGRPRPKTHVFPYTGMIRCAECGCFYTAETKSKRIKGTGEIRYYTYYHCTRKAKAVKCTQRKVVREDVLEAQINAELSKITILPEFRDWALEILNRDNEKEIAERSLVQVSQTKAIDQAQRELDNLTKMLYRELISEEEFKKTREELQAKMRDLRRQREETDSRVDAWLDLTERAFNFAVNARDNFIKGGMQQRKEIFAALGQNFFMKDGKLTINKHNWLIPIEESYPALEAEYRRLEPKESPENKGRTEALASVRQKWLPTLDSRRGWAKPSKCKEIRILVKMYRRRGRGTAISLYDPLPPLPQAPRPVYKNIVAMAVQVREYLIENPQRTQTAAGNRFGITRARVSQLMTIVEKLPDNFISIMKTTEDQSLLKRFSGKTLLKIAHLRTPKDQKETIIKIQNKPPTNG